MKLFLLSIIAISVACLQGLLQDYNSFLQLQGRSRSRSRSKSASNRAGSKSGSRSGSRSGSSGSGSSPSRKSRVRPEQTLLKYLKDYVDDTTAKKLAKFGAEYLRKDDKIEKSRLKPQFLGTLDFVFNSLIFNGVFKDPVRFTGMKLEDLLEVILSDRFFVVITTTSRSTYWDRKMRDELEKKFNTKMFNTGDSTERYCGETVADNKALVTVDDKGIKYVTMLVRMDNIQPAEYKTLSDGTKVFWDNKETPAILKNLITAFGTEEYNTVHECLPDPKNPKNPKPQQGYKDELKVEQAVTPGVLTFRYVMSITPIAWSVSEGELATEEFYKFVTDAVSDGTAKYQGKTYHFYPYSVVAGNKVDVKFFKASEDPQEYSKDTLFPFKTGDPEKDTPEQLVKRYLAHVKLVMNNSITFPMTSNMNPGWLLVLPGAIAIRSDLSKYPRRLGERVFIFNRFVYIVIDATDLPVECRPSREMQDGKIVVQIQGARGISASPMVSTTGAFVKAEKWERKPHKIEYGAFPIDIYVKSKMEVLEASVALGEQAKKEEAAKEAAAYP